MWNSHHVAQAGDRHHLLPSRICTDHDRSLSSNTGTPKWDASVPGGISTAVPNSPRLTVNTALMSVTAILFYERAMTDHINATPTMCSGQHIRQHLWTNHDTCSCQEALHQQCHPSQPATVQVMLLPCCPSLISHILSHSGDTRTWGVTMACGLMGEWTDQPQLVKLHQNTWVFSQPNRSCAIWRNIHNTFTSALQCCLRHQTERKQLIEFLALLSSWENHIQNMKLTAFQISSSHKNGIMNVNITTLRMEM